jgi:hypothetical protein
VSLLEQKFKVSEKIVKIHKEARDHWLNPETIAALEDNSFRSECWAGWQLRCNLLNQKLACTLQ